MCNPPDVNPLDVNPPDFTPLNSRANRYASAARGVSAGAALLALLLPAAGQAQPTLWRPMEDGHAQPDAQAIAPAPAPAPVSRLVKEILELDARRALLIEQRDNPNAASLGALPMGAGQPPAGVSEAAAAQPPGQSAQRLLAIAGVGRNLSAIVASAGQRWVFRAGHAAPIAGPAAGLRLVRIDTPCAVFRSAPDTAARDGPADAPVALRTLCLHRTPP